MATRSAHNPPVAVDEATDSPSEHIIVGVDIGYTRTGVAICSTELNAAEPIPIQQWPGSDATGIKITNKVPTLVTYKAADLRVQSWGFACPPRKDLGDMALRGRFKFLLDSEVLDKANETCIIPESIENIKKFFADFLEELHGHIVTHLEDAPWNVDWGFTKVEYIFSLPTSWESKDYLVEEFSAIIGDAGFGSEDNSTLTIGLTEGVASAVCTAKSVKHKFSEGDILVVCDAGGGTTDICVLRVVSMDKTTVELKTIEQLSIFVGSVQIDDAFAKLFDKKLRDKQLEQPELFRDFEVETHAAQDVAAGPFQQIKLDWGTKVVFGVTPDGAHHRRERLTFPVPGLQLNERVGVPGDVIQAVSLEFSRDEIEAMFNDQIDQIVIEIDKTLEALRGMSSELIASSLILCGGLGSSAYVQSKLKGYSEKRGMRMLVDKKPEEPPLSVCKGLVLDRVQRLLHGTSVLRTRRCRASYGILCHEIYNKIEHKGQEIYTNPANGRKYVTGHIRWFIKKGEEIAEDATKPTIRLEHTRIATLGNPDTTWEDIIVTSRYSPDCLPKFYGQGDSRTVCTIRSNAHPNTLTSKRKYLALGRRFLYGKYEICGFAEQANLRFETRVNGLRVGEGQTPQVPWEYTQDDELVQN